MKSELGADQLIYRKSSRYSVRGVASRRHMVPLIGGPVFQNHTQSPSNERLELVR